MKFNHKKITGTDIRSERISGSKNEFKGKSKAEILADAMAHDKKRAMAKKMK